VLEPGVSQTGLKLWPLQRDSTRSLSVFEPFHMLFMAFLFFERVIARELALKQPIVKHGSTNLRLAYRNKMPGIWDNHLR